MSLVSIEEFAAVAPSELAIADLQPVLDREEAELIRRCGAHGDGVTPVTETYEVTGADLYLPRAAVSLSAIAVASYVGASPIALSSSQYYLVPGQNRVRLSPFLTAAFVTVTYIPQDDRSLRKQVLIELARIAISQTAYKSESMTGVGGASASYTAPDWNAAREAQFARLTGQAV